MSAFQSFTTGIQLADDIDERQRQVRADAQAVQQQDFENLLSTSKPIINSFAKKGDTEGLNTFIGSIQEQNPQFAQFFSSIPAGTDIAPVSNDPTDRFVTFNEEKTMPDGSTQVVQSVIKASELAELTKKGEQPKVGFGGLQAERKAEVKKAVGKEEVAIAGEKVIAQEAAKEKVLTSKPIIQQLKARGASGDFLGSLEAAAETDAKMANVLSIAKGTIPDNRGLDAIKTAILKDNLDSLRTPELQEFKSALEGLIQSVVKENQGSRPSDIDRKVIAESIGNVFAGRVTFEAGVKAIKDQLKSKRQSMVDVARTGFGTDITTVTGFEEFGEQPVDIKDLDDDALESRRQELLKKVGK